MHANLSLASILISSESEELEESEETSDLNVTPRNAAKEINKTDTEEVDIVDKPCPHPTKRPQGLAPSPSSLLDDTDLLYIVLLTLEEPPAPEFLEGSSKDVDQLSQQLHQSASSWRTLTMYG